MRSAAPPVEVPLGTGRREGVLTALCYSATGVLVGAWLAARQAWPLAETLLPVVLGAAAAVVGWFAWRPLQGRLQWDGSAWALVRPDGRRLDLRALELRLDAGGWLLLRAVPAGPRRWWGAAGWCGLTAAEAGRAWHGLRLALHHGGPPGAAEAVRMEG